MNSEVEELNNRFSFNDDGQSLYFEMGEGGIPVVKINNSEASATISLQGAHLFSWVPSDEEEVIWLSSAATFASGKSLRGGIPICWPWFGAHATDSSFPAHGFARTVLWDVAETRPLPGGETQIVFKLDTSALGENTQAMWPLNCEVFYRVTVAKRLSLELTTFNHSDKFMTIGQALHTYFHVNDVSDTVVSGLEGKEYLDKPDNFARKTQTGPVRINAEVDRIYLKTDDDVIIDDQKRKITIKKQGSLSTVVWNPWVDVAEQMGDLGDEGYLQMLCVESANAAEDTVSIKPGDSHTLSVLYQVGEIF